MLSIALHRTFLAEFHVSFIFIVYIGIIIVLRLYFVLQIASPSLEPCDHLLSLCPSGGSGVLETLQNGFSPTIECFCYLLLLTFALFHIRLNALHQTIYCLAVACS